MKFSFSWDLRVVDVLDFALSDGRRDIVIESEKETILLIVSWRGIGSCCMVWWCDDVDG